MAIQTANPSATTPTPTSITSPAGQSYVDTLAQAQKSPTYQPDTLASGAGAKTPEQFAAGNTTGAGPGSTDPSLRAGDVTTTTTPQAGYDAVMKTYLDSLKRVNDLTLSDEQQQNTALNRPGEDLSFAGTDANRIKSTNAFTIDAATNAANANLGAVNAFKDRLPAAPAAAQPFTLNAGDRRYDAQGNLIATAPANPTAAKAPQIIGSAGSGYYSVDPTTGKLTQILGANAGGAGGVGGSAQDIEDWMQAVQNGNSTIAQVPIALRTAVAHALNTATGPDGQGGTYSPLAASRETLAASRIANNFIDLPQYQLTANGLPYLQRIDAALKTPGSVSDQDLLDSLTKLNTAGNAISDAQVKIITDGKSLSDIASTWANKLGNGGVLSNNQRNQIQSIAKAIYANYQKGYQPVYDQVTAQLKAAGIPQQFWTIPDLNNLSGKASGNSNSGNSQTDFSDIQSSITLAPDGKTAYLPRSIWSTLGARQDALLAEAQKDGFKLLIQ